MRHDENRRERREKRAIKRSGNRVRRRTLKRALERNPAEAGADDEPALGWSKSTKELNGRVKDPKRRKKDAEPDFLDEMTAERTAANPDFPRLVAEAEARRNKARLDEEE